MSGRTSWLRDDRRGGYEVVTGYRKTERRNAPARPIQDRLHEVAVKADGNAYRARMAFILPRSLQGFIASGAHGPGVAVLARDFVRISADSSEQCFCKAAAFFRDMARDRKAFTVTTVIASVDMPGRPFVRHVTVAAGLMVVSSGQQAPLVYEVV